MNLFQNTFNINNFCDLNISFDNSVNLYSNIILLFVSFDRNQNECKSLKLCSTKTKPFLLFVWIVVSNGNPIQRQTDCLLLCFCQSIYQLKVDSKSSEWVPNNRLSVWLLFVTHWLFKYCQFSCQTPFKWY